MQRTIPIAILAMAFLGFGHTPANADPSFDCNKAGTPTEYAICGSHRLANLDSQMAAAYYTLRGSLSHADRDRLKYEQRGWLHQRNSCGSDVYCLEDTYLQRISVLQSRIW